MSLNKMLAYFMVCKGWSVLEIKELLKAISVDAPKETITTIDRN